VEGWGGGVGGRDRLLVECFLEAAGVSGGSGWWDKAISTVTVLTHLLQTISNRGKAPDRHPVVGQPPASPLPPLPSLHPSPPVLPPLPFLPSRDPPNTSPPPVCDVCNVLLLYFRSSNPLPPSPSPVCNPCNVLLNDGPRVQLPGGVVRRGTNDLHAAVMGAVVGACTLARGGWEGRERSEV
jgi:hypothetical protein